MKQRYTIVAHCYDKRGILISCATNNYEKSHPLQKYFAERVGHNEKIYLHAEIAAILAAKGQPIHRIEISRFNKKGEISNAKPCPICMEAIQDFGIDKICYTTDRGYEYVVR